MSVIATIENPAIPKDSVVLITGANGFIASHVVHQLIQYGYKHAWLSAYFDKTYGKGHFELLCVPDMTAGNAFDEAIKRLWSIGVSAFIYMASVKNLDPGPNKSAVVAIKTAYRGPFVNRFVLTSSSSVILPVHLQAFLEMKSPVVTEDSWSPDAKELAWTPGLVWEPGHSVTVYITRKIEQEQTVRKDNQSKRPDLVVNAGISSENESGKESYPIDQGHPCTSGILVLLFQGKVLDSIQKLPQVKLGHGLTFNIKYALDVQDDAHLHVAAAALPDVKSQRIFAFAHPLWWDNILEVFRKQYPDKKFPDNFYNEPYPAIIKPRDRAEELLKRLGKPGWTPFEETLKMNVDDLYAADDV
ncbi:LOW QUALITY PROTEIN: uncharacterized protein LY79DRAFT_588592 [Colletotrichum navitas]|uniref:Aldehyde reductase II n=1 Tax=Colletotrichum navitas TaxID=681940 RepID=A0AAD8Q4V6_9PEZI|nr:LOW QUALITY PROTEIN: uncharacterized protein LY79DRAFT_588592 [Colletotrichum navitas]KAK1595614.1 LOW QUALITY PROTEIN: hypothetical protein LY79DRAFT_588592 [Colletotrichum navitas]